MRENTIEWLVDSADKLKRRFGEQLRASFFATSFRASSTSRGFGCPSLAFPMTNYVRVRRRMYIYNISGIVLGMALVRGGLASPSVGRWCRRGNWQSKLGNISWQACNVGRSCVVSGADPVPPVTSPAGALSMKKIYRGWIWRLLSISIDSTVNIVVEWCE